MSLRADTGTNKLAVQEHCYLWYPGSNDTRVPLTGKWMCSRWADRDGTPCLLTTLPQHFSFALAHLVPAHLPPPCPLPLPAGLPNWQSAPYISNQQDNVPFGGICTNPQAADFTVPAPFYNPAGIDVEVRLHRVWLWVV